MKSGLKITIFVAAVVLITVSTKTQSQQPHRALTDTPGFTDLTLELDTHKQRFVQFEPIPITLRISNKTAKQLVGHNAIIFGSPYLNLYMLEENGQRRRMKHLTVESVLLGVNPITFEPDDSYSRTHLLTLSLGENFPQAGDYRIQGELSDLNSQEKITSNVVKIKISAPAGLDYAALDFLKNNVNASNFFTGVYRSNPGTVREFISRYEHSVYGDHAVFMLGEYYLANKDYEKALEQFSKLADKQDFVLAEKVSEHIKKIKENLGVMQ